MMSSLQPSKLGFLCFYIVLDPDCRRTERDIVNVDPVNGSCSQPWNPTQPTDAPAGRRRRRPSGAPGRAATRTSDTPAGLPDAEAAASPSPSGAMPGSRRGNDLQDSG